MTSLSEISKLPGFDAIGSQAPLPPGVTDANAGFAGLMAAKLGAPAELASATAQQHDPGGEPASGKLLPVAGGSGMPELPLPAHLTESPGPNRVDMSPMPPAEAAATSAGQVTESSARTDPSSAEDSSGQDGPSLPAAPPVVQVHARHDLLPAPIAMLAEPPVAAAPRILKPAPGAPASASPAQLVQRLVVALEESKAQTARADGSSHELGLQKAAKGSEGLPNLSALTERLAKMQSVMQPGQTASAMSVEAPPPAQYMSVAPSAQGQTLAPLTGQASASGMPQMFETLVDRLVEAREAARPARAEMSMTHDDFGRVTLRMEAGRMETGAAQAGLRVALSSPDPDFAPIAQAALTDRSAADGDRAAADQSRNDQIQRQREDAQRHDSQRHEGGQPEQRQYRHDHTGRRSDVSEASLLAEGASADAAVHPKTKQRGLFA